MSYKDIFRQLKEEPLKPVYLLHGEEDYVREKAREEIMRRALGDALPELNHVIYSGDVSFQELEEATQALPFMAEKRLIEVRDHKALARVETEGEAAAKGKADAKGYARLLESIPESTCLIFVVRGSVSARNALLKQIKEYGAVLSFDYLSQTEAAPYLMRFARQGQCAITRETAEFLYQYSGEGLEHLSHEMEKLCAGTQGEITRDMVRAMCTQSTQWKVFTLLDDIFAGKADAAMAQMCGMLDDGENPAGILSLMERQFRLMALATQGGSRAELAQELSVKPFVLEKAARQARRFSLQGVLGFLQRCARTDLFNKQGMAQERTALELLVMEIIETAKA